MLSMNKILSSILTTEKHKKDGLGESDKTINNCKWMRKRFVMVEKCHLHELNDSRSMVFSIL
jgi:hypothetical protein